MAMRLPPRQPSIAALRERAAGYALFGRFLEAEVDTTLLALMDGPLQPALASLGAWPEVSAEPADRDTVLVRLASEYTSLFVAPGAISPYASVFETGALYQDQTDLADAAYRLAGVRFTPRHSGEFPDHIGVMLSFYGLLLRRQADALAQGGVATAGRWQRQADDFLVTQLAPWAVAWCRLAARAARHRLYQRLLDAAAEILWDDIAATVSPAALSEIEARNRRQPARLDYDADFRKASGL